MQPDFIKSLLEQDLVSHDEGIARELANKANPRELQPNETLYTKGDEANFIFLILDGSCKIVDGTRVIAVIERGTFVGEFPLLGVSRAYAVTAVAGERSFLAQVSYADFRDIAAKHPQIWELMAAKLARRLNDLLRSSITRSSIALPP
jgi:CRP-like cAMP-binding protein